MEQPPGYVTRATRTEAGERRDWHEHEADRMALTGARSSELDLRRGRGAREERRGGQWTRQDKRRRRVESSRTARSGGGLIGVEAFADSRMGSICAATLLRRLHNSLEALITGNVPKSCQPRMILLGTTVTSFTPHHHSIVLLSTHATWRASTGCCAPANPRSVTPYCTSPVGCGLRDGVGTD